MDYFISTLENGFKVIIHNIPHAKTITSSLWIRQGSQFEDSKNNGISHFLEHIMFDLNRTTEGNDISNELNKFGAKINAATTKEFIFFKLTTLNNEQRFELAIKALYSIATQPLSEKTFDREKQIVINEIDLGRENETQQNCFYALWDKYSIGLPVLGKKDVINSMSFDEMNKFFKENIVPSNSFFVIIGNLDQISSPVNIIKNYFSNWKNNLDRLIKPKSILVKSGPKIISNKIESDMISISIGFNGLNFNNPNSRILDFLSFLLTDGIYSRLYQKLRIENKIIYSIRSNNYSFGFAGAFVISTTFKQKYLNDVINCLMEELNKLKTTLVSQHEISQISERFITKLTIELENPASLINFVGRYYSLGKIFSYHEYISEILNITDQEIMDISKRIFKVDNISFSATGDFNEDSLIELLSKEI